MTVQRGNPPSSDMKQLVQWLKAPENKTAMQNLLKESVVKATETSQYLKQAQQTDKKVLLEPVTL